MILPSVAPLGRVVSPAAVPPIDLSRTFAVGQSLLGTIVRIVPYSGVLVNFNGQQALLDYIGQHPGEISKPDTAFRRVPLNFRRPIEAPARSSGEWAARRGRADERILWNTCAGCHEGHGIDQVGRPVFEKTNIAKQWLPRASFDHNAHGMLKCAGCHAAEASTQTSDVVLPTRAACAACHAPSKGAESRCFECHSYHDWSKAHRVQPSYSPADFK